MLTVTMGMQRIPSQRNMSQTEIWLTSWTKVRLN